MADGQKSQNEIENHLVGLPMENFIKGPLTAASDAQRALAAISEEKANKTKFDTDDTDKPNGKME